MKSSESTSCGPIVLPDYLVDRTPAIQRLLKVFDLKTTPESIKEQDRLVGLLSDSQFRTKDGPRIAVYAAVNKVRFPGVIPENITPEVIRRLGSIEASDATASLYVFSWSSLFYLANRGDISPRKAQKLASELDELFKPEGSIGYLFQRKFSHALESAGYSLQDIPGALLAILNDPVSAKTNFQKFLPSQHT